MKNITISIMPLLTPPMPIPMSPAPALPSILPSKYAATFSVQFEDEAETMEFAKFIIDAIETFRQGDR